VTRPITASKIVSSDRHQQANQIGDSAVLTTAPAKNRLIKQTLDIIDHCVRGGVAVAESIASGFYFVDMVGLQCSWIKWILLLIILFLIKQLYYVICKMRKCEG
jgi:hypothetical protein